MLATISNDLIHIMFMHVEDGLIKHWLGITQVLAEIRDQALEHL